ncbi:MAG: glycosyltransferase family 39 protein [Acidobacteriaceae bacterium]|nr:glycosyltransferase family 39 protein [Acidobacteriaceae bacterium]
MTETAPATSRFKAPRALFWTALGVRLAYILLAHMYHVRAAGDHFQFGWEMGRIARALVTGFGYSDPFTGHTGPTAWVPPLYTLLIAAAFKVFGVYTGAAAFWLLAFNSVCSAVTAVLVYEIGARCFGRRNAVWAGWLWALHPAAMQYAVKWIWEMTLSTMLLTAVIVLALRMRRIGENVQAGDEDAQTLGRWLLFGLLWGLIALSNPALLAFLPVCGVWLLLGARRRMHAAMRAAVAAAVCCAVIAPWAMRNWKAFGAFIPLRSNFGAELALGDGPDAMGFLMEYNHPMQSARQLRLYSELGELRYVQMRGAQAKAAIAADPAHFLAISATRFYFFWVSVPQPLDRHPAVEYAREMSYCFISLAGLMGLGLALRKRVPAAGLFAWAFLLLPLTYYFVTAQARFRHPIEPLIWVLGVWLFENARVGKA